MVEGGNMTEVGRIYIDSKGAGRLYIPRKVVEHLNFENGERVLIRSHGNRMEILRLSEVVNHA